jgi:hypothetical protein
MSANLYCWEPSLSLKPSDPEFGAQLDRVCNSSSPPSPQLIRFVEALLARYLDLTQTDDTVWSDEAADQQCNWLLHQYGHHVVTNWRSDADNNSYRVQSRAPLLRPAIGAILPGA